jgi:hypothetical protein
MERGKITMTDVLIATVIGGVIGIIGSVIGSAIKGYYDSKNIKKQLEQQLKILQVERIIKIKAEYLNTLVSQLKAIVVAIQNITPQLGYLSGLCEEDMIAWADSRSEEYLETIRRHCNLINIAIVNIKMLQSQITDLQIIDSTYSQIVLYEQLDELISNLENMRVSCGEGVIFIEPNKKIYGKCAEIKSVLNQMSTIIRKTNARVEEILSGMD